MKKIIFTSESVTEGHPDKVCDQISDAVLDAIIADDKNARVACETLTSTGLILVAGEITTNTYVDIKSVARETVREIGYDNPKYGFSADSCAILTTIEPQSPDIDMGVTRSSDDEFDLIGAGDQGMMFGYATDESENYMPLPIDLAHKLAIELARLRKDNVLDYLRPDGKTQVSMEYVDGVAKRIDTIVVSTQHDEDVSVKEIAADLKKELILPTVGEMMDDETKILVNPTGRFVYGGPAVDVGLTGRKLIVDTYGGFSRHGGGAFSGKDPTKVDRSASYYARYMAKNVVAAGLAKKCEIGLAYAIGVARPVSIYVDTFGTGVIADNAIEEILDKVFDPRPAAIIKNLDLRRPIYKQVASYGHFGRNDLDLPWEKLDKVEELKKQM